MRIIMVNPIHFEKWDWRNSVEKGIGGSETSAVEMAHRIARRGHEVVVYAPIPDDCPGRMIVTGGKPEDVLRNKDYLRTPAKWRDTWWLPLEAVDWSMSGVWVLYRCPELVDKLIEVGNPSPAWTLMQDWDYPTWTPERIARLNRIIPLCKAHERWLVNRHPEFEGKTWVTRNGIKADLIAEVMKSDIPERNPKRIMYASSPDRGLESALKIFKRAKDYDPDLELHITYGFNNVDKLIGDMDKHPLKRMKDRCVKLVEETGAVFHGRMSQNQLYREWLKTAMNVYCTTFWETGYITGLEGMALGAIPIFSPIWAQGENLNYGVPIAGDPGDPLTIARFVDAVVKVASSEEGQHRMRRPMMDETRLRWDWERFVDQWCQAAEEDLKPQVSTRVDTPAVSVLTPSIRPEGLPVVYECLKRQVDVQWEWLICVPLYLREQVAALYAHDSRVRVLLDPPLNPDDQYGLNKAWNLLLLEAANPVVVFATDWTWFSDNAFRKLIASVNAPTGFAGVMVPADHYDKLDSPAGRPENKVWDMFLKQQGHDFYEINAEGMEFVLAAFPKHALVNVGGLDEEYDRYSGLSEKEICLRMEKLYDMKFFVDNTIDCRSVVHAKEFPMWDQLYKTGLDKFNHDRDEVNAGNRLRLDHLARRVR